MAAVDDLGRGDDVIYGEAGNDWIHGGRHDDLIDGGIGDDRLNGGAGTDILTGGAGSDVFEFRGQHGNDVITDFSAEDELHLMRSMNGLQDITADSLSSRMFDISAGTWLDLGEDNSITFLGIDSQTLSGLLETNLHYL